MVLPGPQEGGGVDLRLAPDFPFLLLIASGGSSWRRRPDAGQRWLQSAPCPLLTFGDLGGSGGLGPGGRALRVLAWVEEPGGAPGICCAQTGPSLCPIVAPREPSAA